MFYPCAMDIIDPVQLTRELIRRPSVTPKDEGALDVLIERLTPLGFQCHDLTFPGPGQPHSDGAPVRNLFAQRGQSGPHFCFAGHTDVVPSGAEEEWRHPPFSAEIEDGAIWGRGAVDMKGAIAAFVSATSRVLADDAFPGTISLMITGDEEGPAVNGTKKILDWLEAANIRFDHCLVGEPTSVETLGDMIKVGRRGSVNCWLTVFGVQGHVAYPHRASNPIPALLRKLLRLSETPLDDGYPRFQPSSLQITDIHIGNEAHNVIPSKATARFNIRFNPTWTGDALETWLRRQIDDVAEGLKYDLSCVVSGEAFLTTDDTFIDLLRNEVKDRTGQDPDPSTSGGTSDARFIRSMAPVVEFGLVGESMHKTDEHAVIADIQRLTDVYEGIIRRYFAAEWPGR